MSLSLFDAFVPGCLQILDALDGVLDKGEAFAKENGLSAADLIQARLYDNMLPFAYQVKSCWVHSALAIEGVRTGTFSPESSEPPVDWASLHAKVAEARTALKATSADELESMADNVVDFSINGKVLMTFVGQDFLLSFSQPNFYFHATTAYDILRERGVPLGKLDYLGPMRIKAPG
ncbi:MAG: DUF1993 family protein [Novosphingobium sp.]